MYIWKIDKLVADLRAGDVSQKEQLKYVLLYTAMSIIFSDPYFLGGAPYNPVDSVTTATTILASVSGIYYCYSANSAGDNRDFFLRIMCIGVPVTIRVLAVFLPANVLVALLNVYFGGELMASTSSDGVVNSALVFAATTTLCIVVGYVYAARKIRAVSS